MVTLAHPSLEATCEVPEKSVRALALSGWVVAEVLEPVDPASPGGELDKDALLDEAQRLGVEGVNGRWGVDRLRDAIASHEPLMSEED